MYETVWLGLIIVAGGFSALQLFAHEGGVMATLAAILLWVSLYFGSSNVLATTSSGLVTTNNPTVVWVAAFMAGVHTLVLLVVLLGIGPWSPDEDEDSADAPGMAAVPREMGDRL